MQLKVLLVNANFMETRSFEAMLSFIYKTFKNRIVKRGSRGVPVGGGGGGRPSISQGMDFENSKTVSDPPWSEARTLTIFDGCGCKFAY